MPKAENFKSRKIKGPQVSIAIDNFENIPKINLFAVGQKIIGTAKVDRSSKY